MDRTVKSFFTFCLTMILLAPSIVKAEDDLKSGAWVPLPAISSSPETGFELGAYVMRLFPQQDLDIPRNRLEVLLSGTSKGLFQGYVWPTYYVNEDLQWVGTFGGSYWPGTYYGVGNDFDELGPTESYEARTAVMDLWLSKRWFGDLWWSVGLLSEYEQLTQDDTVNLIDENTPGVGDVFYRGIGLSASYDRRDNGDFPTQGLFLGSSLVYYDTGDLNFTRGSLRVSHNVPAGDSLVFASGARIISSSEDTPFRKLPAPSGSSILRGANSAHFVDRQLLAAQVEMRWSVAQSWGIGVFIDGAQVAPNINDFASDRFHSSIGAGFRYNTLKDERLNVRADIALVDGESIGMAISIGEAF